MNEQLTEKVLEEVRIHFYQNVTVPNGQKHSPVCATQLTGWHGMLKYDTMLSNRNFVGVLAIIVIASCYCIVNRVFIQIHGKTNVMMSIISIRFNSNNRTEYAMHHLTSPDSVTITFIDGLPLLPPTFSI